MIHHSEPVTAARSSDGPEGRLLGFRGAQRPVVAIADEDGAGCPARLGSEEHWAGREPSGLDPADGDDSVTNEAVAVVQVENDCHVLTVMAEQVTCELRSRRRPVDPTGEVELRFGHSVRVADAPP